MKDDLVSIVMPSYNSVYIAESIKSIIAQSYQNWELLITDDYSNDNTIDIVKSFVEKDKRIKLFVSESNAGAGAARNNSIKQAQGQFIAFCDSDDMWLPTKLEKQVHFMKSNAYAFSFTSYYVCDNQGIREGVINCKRKISYLTLLKDNCVGCLTGMYDAKQLGLIFMPSLRKRQDWCLWLSIIRKCKSGYGLQEKLAVYRKIQNSVSSNKLSLITFNIKVYTDFLRYPKLIAYIIFLCLFIPTYFIKKALYLCSSMRIK